MASDSYDIAAPEPSGSERQTTMRAVAEYSKTVFITLIVALMIKAFVVEAFRIPSGSMENTLQVGDFLLVNKLAYGIRTPRYLPMTNSQIPALIVPLFSSVRRGDIVVFEFPGQTGPLETDDQLNYIKRCIGLPGDTVMIRQSRVFVNGKEMTFPSGAKLGDHGGIDFRQRGLRLVPGGRGYTESEYGPVVVPRRGDVITLTGGAVDEWKSLILREGHRVAEGAEGSVLIDGTPATTYTLKDDYYFVLGDNRHNSLDSRFWGFVPNRFLVGEALLVYWSWNPDIAVTEVWEKIRSIRWGRIGMLIR